MRGDIPDQWIEKEYRESYEAWCVALRSYQEAQRAYAENKAYAEAHRVAEGPGIATKPRSGSKKLALRVSCCRRRGIQPHSANTLFEAEK